MIFENLSGFTLSFRTFFGKKSTSAFFCWRQSSTKSFKTWIGFNICIAKSWRLVWEWSYWTKCFQYQGNCTAIYKPCIDFRSSPTVFHPRGVQFYRIWVEINTKNWVCMLYAAPRTRYLTYFIVKDVFPTIFYLFCSPWTKVWLDFSSFLINLSDSLHVGQVENLIASLRWTHTVLRVA